MSHVLHHLSDYFSTSLSRTLLTRFNAHRKCIFSITGSPIRNLNIQCWSLFRDVDFHTRFHFDHYEYSGQWHGQYRGYKHGRVHEVTSDHEHLIDVALALELSLAGSWISAVRF